MNSVEQLVFAWFGIATKCGIKTFLSKLGRMELGNFSVAPINSGKLAMADESLENQFTKGPFA